MELLFTEIEKGRGRLFTWTLNLKCGLETQAELWSDQGGRDLEFAERVLSRGRPLRDAAIVEGMSKEFGSRRGECGRVSDGASQHLEIGR